MAENLFPVENEVIEEEQLQNEEVKYVDGPMFDTDLSLNGKNDIITCSSAESWAIWCRKVLETPRNKCECYAGDYGIDINAVFSSDSHEEAENILSSEISNTLLNADSYNRTAYVESIDYEWVGSDSVTATVQIVGHDGFAITIKTTLTN